MWERWRQGDALREVARLLERHPSSVFKKLSRTGGMQPAERSRSSRALTLDDREARNIFAHGDINVSTLELTAHIMFVRSGERKSQPMDLGYLNKLNAQYESSRGHLSKLMKGLKIVL